MNNADIDAAALAVLFLVLYFVPAAVALWRRHPSWRAIVAVDLLLGWSIAGWLWAFFWSLTAVRREHA